MYYQAIYADLGLIVSEEFLSKNKFFQHRIMDSGLYVLLRQGELFAFLGYYYDPELEMLTMQTYQTPRVL